MKRTCVYNKKVTGYCAIKGNKKFPNGTGKALNQSEEADFETECGDVVTVTRYVFKASKNSRPTCYHCMKKLGLIPQLTDKQKMDKMYDLIHRMRFWNSDDAGGDVSFGEFFADELETIESECRPEE